LVRNLNNLLILQSIAPEKEERRGGEGERGRGGEWESGRGGEGERGDLD
jgi:hypothetical protein